VRPGHDRGALAPCHHEDAQSPKQFGALGRVVWLVVGMILGAIAWNLIERNMLERKFGRPAQPTATRLLADPRIRSLSRML